LVAAFSLIQIRGCAVLAKVNKAAKAPKVAKIELRAVGDLRPYPRNARLQRHEHRERAAANDRRSWLA
jgi:hypothetical protein